MILLIFKSVQALFFLFGRLEARSATRGHCGESRDCFYWLRAGAFVPNLEFSGDQSNPNRHIVKVG